MKTHTQYTGYFFSALLLFFSFCIPSFSLASENSATTSDKQNIQVVQGKVRAYNLDKQSILLKTTKGEKMTISLDWNTGLVGYSSPQDIEKGHAIKIWYSVVGERHHAVKVEKKLDVGC